MALAEFYLTDGTNRLNLLAANQHQAGIGIEKVRFARPQRDSESIFVKRYKTLVENYAFRIVEPSQDAAIATLRTLESFLLQAENYFSGTANYNPVWLVSRAYKESNYRYAMVLGGMVAEYPDIYQQPFVNMAPRGWCIADDLELNLTRTTWIANPPNAPKTLTTLATHAPAASVFYVGNNFTEEPLKSIKVFDSSATSYVTYAALPYPGGAALLPAVPANNDALYLGFGPKSAGTAAMPNGLFINALTAGSNVTTAVWEYWNGAAWVALPDVVDGWLKASAGTVQWIYATMDNWAANAVNGVTLNWIRWRVTAVGGGPTPPTANLIYTLQNYVEISGIRGDIPALMDLQIDSTQQAGTGDNPTYEIYMGLRCTDRGATFYPWLIPTSYGGSAVVDSYAYVATGRGITFVPETDWTIQAQYKTYGRTIGGVPSVSKDYTGQFRVFVRIAFTGTYDGLSLRFGIGDDSAYSSGGVIQTGKQTPITPWTASAALAVPKLYDLGVATLGGRDRANYAEMGGMTSIYLECKSEATTAETFIAYDMFLLPIDEWSCKVTDTDRNDAGMWHSLVGSASYFRQQIRGVIYDPLNLTQILRSAIVETSGPAILQPNKTQRLYFLTSGIVPIDGQPINRHETSHRIRIKTQEMFLGMRGNG